MFPECALYVECIVAFLLISATTNHAVHNLCMGVTHNLINHRTRIAQQLEYIFAKRPVQSDVIIIFVQCL